MGSYYELGLIAFILIGIAVVFWKGGAANPIGTARLQHDLRNVRQEVTEIGNGLKTLGGTVESEKLRIDKIDLRMAAVEKQIDSVHTVTTALSESTRALIADLREHREYVTRQLSVLTSMDERVGTNTRNVEKAMQCLEAIDARQDRMGEQVASIEVQSAATGRQVDRLYDFLTKKALDT